MGEKISGKALDYNEEGAQNLQSANTEEWPYNKAQEAYYLYYPILQSREAWSQEV